MFSLLTKSSQQSEILESGFKLYKFSYTQGALLAFIASFFFLVPLYWPYITLTSNIHISEHSVTHLLMLSLSWLLSLIFSLGLLFKLHCLCNGIQNSTLQSIKQSLYRLVTTLLVAALYLIIVFSGTMLLIVPGFILSITLMFSFMMVVNENKGVLQSLLTSHQLVWGNWWHTFVIMSVPLLLNIIIMLLAFVLLVSIFSKALFQITGWYYYVFALHLILQSLLLPLTFSIALVLFNDLRIKQRQNQSPFTVG
ncbi:MAG: hypothetical protein AB7D28_03665 [Candidatus Berkiella sp.]